MPINKNRTHENGVVSDFHRVERVVFLRTAAGGLACALQVASWASAADAAAGAEPLMRETLARVPLAVPPGLLEEAETMLRMWQDSPLAGGSEAADVGGTPLEVAKAQKWREILAERDRREFGTFVAGVYELDCDPKAQARIQGAVQLASLAAANGQPFSIDWTMADNTVVTLNAATMVGIGQALALHVGQVHATARALRSQIDAAATVAAVQEIAWPA